VALMQAPTDPTTALFDFLRAAVMAIRPAAATTLPALASSLDETRRATESSTQRALEQAEVLGALVGRLADALSRVQDHLPLEPGTRTAWSEAVEACLAIAPAVSAIVRALEFREGAAQNLGQALDSTRALQASFEDVLARLSPPR
jgi:hypothetical protein